MAARRGAGGAAAPPHGGWAAGSSPTPPPRSPWSEVAAAASVLALGAALVGWRRSAQHAGWEAEKCAIAERREREEQALRYAASSRPATRAVAKATAQYRAQAYQSEQWQSELTALASGGAALDGPEI